MNLPPLPVLQALIATVTFLSVLGSLVYFLCRAIEKWWPDAALTFSLLACFVFVFLSPVVFFGFEICIFYVLVAFTTWIGSRVHLMSGAESANSLNAWMFIMWVSQLILVSGVLLLFFPLVSYKVLGIQYLSRPLLFGAFLASSFITPVLAATLVYVYRTLQLRPGLDEPIDG